MTGMAETHIGGDLQRDFLERGVVHVHGLLTGQALQDALSAYEWSIGNPGPGATIEFAGATGEIHQDLSNPAAVCAYRSMLDRSPIPRLLSRVWNSDSVWFMYEQIFLKQMGGLRTPWHQDSPYLPVEGKHLGVAWITFDQVSALEALEFCLGSHRGPLYSAIKFDRNDPTAPLYINDSSPRIPDIEAQREKWPVEGWATEPGDVLIFHPSVLHGGGAPSGSNRRRTLTLRFFGDDAVYARRPGPTPVPRVEGLHDSLSPGQPFRHPAFPKLV
jgi:ectoine hydroxylase-related dioxygenase (phytanoyl-CoA dioxygenase family)